MLQADSPTLLVAKFLKANHYTETLDAFLREAGLDEEAAVSQPGDLTIDQILKEKRQYDAALAYEKREHVRDAGWTKLAPVSAKHPQGFISANAVCVYYDGDTIISSHVDRGLNMIETDPPYTLHTITGLADSTILSIASVGLQELLLTTLSGQTLIFDKKTNNIIDRWNSHAKHAIQVIKTVLPDDSEDTAIVATAGNDCKINIYTLNSSHSASILETINFPTPPVCLLFVCNPDTNVLYLVAARRDSTKLHYYSITKDQVTYTGSQNLAPHSTAWVIFSPSSLAACPTDPTLVAVATTHTPHMKLILVRLLFSENSGPTPQPQSQASQARAELAEADREEAAIRLQVSTMAPQTDYSNPQVVWRPDGTGVWVNGDDGAIRGIEVKTGKVFSTLKGHDPGAKVRSLWAGHLPSEDGKEREVLISGGFDKKVLIWECEEG